MAESYSYGVQYSPSSVSIPKLTMDALEVVHGIRYIRLQFVDFTNTVRYRVIPISYFKKILSSPRPSTSISKVALGMAFLTVADGFSAIGEYLHVPDMATLRICPYAPGHASVMGWFEEKLPVPGPGGNPTLKVDICPRAILQRVVEEAKLVSGIEFLVGFETEFILLKSTSPIEAGNDYSWSVSAGLATGTVETIVLEEIAEALQESGVELQMYHAEAAPGQYEVITGPLSPLQAADALVHTRETIFNIASKHKLRATLAPRVFPDSCGSGAHTHISVHPCKPSPTSSQSPDLNEVEASFLSSVLAHLPALTAINLPIPASYKRMTDGVWTGGTYVCWGTDNREAPIRLCNASSPASRNFELKTVDGTANPYLALAGVLGAGHVGIRDRQQLTMKDCSGGKSAAQLDANGRQALGITKRLPLSWEEARANFGEDKVVRGIFGDNFVAKYLSVNETLAKCLAVGTEEQALTLLVETY